MQRSITVLLLLTTIVAGCARQPEPMAFSDADASAVRAAGSAYVTAVRDTAWTTWADFYTDDAVLLPPNEAAIGDRGAMLRWARAFPPLTTFTLTTIEVDGRGDLAYVYGRYAWVAAPPGAPAMPDSGKYIEIWRKQSNGGWKMARDIFNSDIPLAAPTPPKK